MSKDIIKVNMNVYDIPIVVEQLKKLEQENKQLREALLNIKEFIDKHTEIVPETKTKYLITSVNDDNELIDIVNEALYKS